MLFQDPKYPFFLIISTVDSLHHLAPLQPNAHIGVTRSTQSFGGFL
jgi:hypothetical protein